MIGIVSLEDDVKTWAAPLMADIAKYEPNMNVMLTIAAPGEGSYAASINQLGREWRKQYPDDPWFLPMNADVSCTGPFQELLDQMPPGIYGPTINQRKEMMWIDGWLYVIHQSAWDLVGEFDEKFLIACFEDADYTWRAAKAGVNVGQVQGFPFIHHRASPRMRVPNFWKVRKQNQQYLIDKWGLSEEWSYR